MISKKEGGCERLSTQGGVSNGEKGNGSAYKVVLKGEFGRGGKGDNPSQEGGGTCSILMGGRGRTFQEKSQGGEGKGGEYSMKRGETPNVSFYVDVYVLVRERRKERIYSGQRK